MPSPTPTRIKKIALLASAISACVVGLVCAAAILGSEAAAKILLVLILPRFNFLSALLPEDLGGVPAGLELILLAAWLQIAVVLTLLFVGVQALTGRTVR